jgi:Tfp pilus assembly protein PilN
MSQQINLFNPALLKQTNFLSAVNLVVVLVTSVVLLLAAYAYVGTQTTKIKQANNQSVQRLSQLSSQANQLRESQAARVKNPALLQELALIESSLLRRHQIAQILQNREFGNTDGYSSYLIAFARQIPANVWLTGLTLEGAGHDLTVHGRTLQAELLPQYVTQLKREAIMQGKTFSTLQMERPLLPVPAEVSAADPKKLPEPAPYVEFQLHSSEKMEKEKAQGVKP